MDSNTTITGVIFVLFCMVLFVLINRNKRKKEKQFLQPLNRLAAKENCKISQYDSWNNSVIGIDETANFIFTINKIIDNETSQSINLAEMQRCRLAESSRTESTKEGSIKVFDRISLVFSNVDKAKPDVIVEFYNSNTDRLTLTGELQLAEKWCEIANDKIATLTKMK